MPEQTDEQRMRLRYAGICRICSTVLEAHAEAVYERSTKTVRCLGCIPSAPAADFPGSEAAQEAETARSDASRPGPVADAINPGTAGASARREHQRRQGKREERIRAKHPKLGGLILAMSDDPTRPPLGPLVRSERNAWAFGSTNSPHPPCECSMTAASLVLAPTSTTSP